jgi:hypothetical protein
MSKSMPSQPKNMKKVIIDQNQSIFHIKLIIETFSLFKKNLEKYTFILFFYQKIQKKMRYK